DAGTDSGLDAAPDVITDAGSDATAEAAPDAGAGADAATVVLAADVTDGVLALDDTNVYFTTSNGAGVSGVPKTGGPTFVVAQPTGGLQGGIGALHLHLESGILYWDAESTLVSVPAAARNVPATIIGDFGLVAFDFAVVGSTAYGASDFQDVTTLPTTPDAGTHQWLFSNNDTGLWFSFQLDAENGTLDGLESGNGKIDRIPLDGGVPTSLNVDPHAVAMAIQEHTMYLLAVPACNDYGADSGCISTLYSSLPDGTNPSIVVSELWPFTTNVRGIECIGAITAKYAFLFIEGGILRVTLATGENHVVYSYPATANPAFEQRGYIAADDDFLYVVDSTAGLVRIAH
ncbi:MAG TPA: hypothetical protein VGI39_39260, partial [Polyangiaceae bacterium]